MRVLGAAPPGSLPHHHARRFLLPPRASALRLAAGRTSTQTHLAPIRRRAPPRQRTATSSMAASHAADMAKERIILGSASSSRRGAALLHSAQSRQRACGAQANSQHMPAAAPQA